MKSLGVNVGANTVHYVNFRDIFNLSFSNHLDMVEYISLPVHFFHSIIFLFFSEDIVEELCDGQSPLVNNLTKTEYNCTNDK